MEKFPSAKILPLEFREHLNIIQNFTLTYKDNINENIAIREIRCLRSMYPYILAPIEEGDLFAGKIRMPAICFIPQAGGNEGGFGYVCNLEMMSDLLKHHEATENDRKILRDLTDFWSTERTIYKTRQAYSEKLKTGLPSDNWTGSSGIAFPLYRMAGTHLDYSTLLNLGIQGLKDTIKIYKEKSNRNDSLEFYQASLEALDLFAEICIYYAELAEKLAGKCSDKHRSDLQEMAYILRTITQSKPSSFRAAIQLTFLYCIISGSNNYGRIDDYLSDYYCKDLDSGIINYEEALRLFEGYWRMMISRNAPYDGRAIIGGLGRQNEKKADKLALLAIETAFRVKDILPQLTLRFHKNQNPELYQKALDAIGEGSTYPMLYNDDVNIPAHQKAFKITYEEACQVIPFGCGEYIINHQSVGTPSSVFNLLKALEVLLHKGIDPVTLQKAGIQNIPLEFDSFDVLSNKLKEQIKYYIDLLAEQETVEYRLAGNTAPFLYLSILYDDCLKNGKGIFSGGARYIGGTMEIYGFTNTADSLTAIRKIVYEAGKITLDDLLNILDANFQDYENERSLLLGAPKYGNDNQEADQMASDLHDFICNYTRESINHINLHSYLVVNINNDANTTLGRFTSASADGRKAFTSMSNGNAPSPGMDKNGPTALLNSLNKIDASIHAGAVQNLKFSREMFTTYRPQMEALLRAYFKNGGTQAMITVVGRDDLLNAIKDPEKYSNLIVRVGGFSARFIELSPEVQQEIIERTLY